MSSQEFTQTYDHWATMDQACVVYAGFVESLKERRAAVTAAAWRDPQAATGELASLDARLTAAATIIRELWERRTTAYQAFKRVRSAEAKARGAAKRKRKTEASR